MANVQLPWEVQGIITPEESVLKMIEVIKSKGIQHSGTFWTYENKVCSLTLILISKVTNIMTALRVVKTYDCFFPSLHIWVNLH